MQILIFRTTIKRETVFNAELKKNQDHITVSKFKKNEINNVKAYILNCHILNILILA